LKKLYLLLSNNTSNSTIITTKMTIKPSPSAIAASRVLLVYGSAFVFAIGIQLYCKVRAKIENKKEGKPFNRYDSDKLYLLAADRGVGNYVEWAPAFLAFFGGAMLVEGPEVAKWGYLYACCRFLYPVVAQLGGIAQKGATPLIYFATVPMYAVLVRLGTGILQHAVLNHQD
jgi:hypothetical protein